MFVDNVLQPSQLEKEIIRLKKEIISLKLLGETSMSQEISDLRTIVLDAHADAEEVLSGIVMKSIFASAYDYKKYGYKKNFKEFKKKFEKAFGKVGSLMRLADSALGTGEIDEVIWEQLRQLNSIRVTLAHPRDGKWKKFEDREMYKWALQVVIAVTRAIAVVDVNFGIKGV